MSQSDNSHGTHDEVFAQNADISRNIQRPSKSNAPLLPPLQASVLSAGVGHSQNNKAEYSAEPGCTANSASIHRYDGDEDDDCDRPLRIGRYFAVGFLVIAVGLAAYWFGANDGQIFRQVPVNIRDAGQDEKLPLIHPVPPTRTGDASPSPKAPELKSPPVASNAPVAEIRRTETKDNSVSPTSSFDLIVSRLLRLDDEFSRLKIDFIDMKKAEEMRAHNAVKSVAWTKAISMGYLNLRVSADERSKSNIPLVYVPAGHFIMGQTEAQRGESARASTSAHYDFSVPAHPVQVQSGYFIGIYEVTVGQLEEFVSQQNLGEPTTAAHRYANETDRNKPACNIDWGTAMKFCDWLSHINNIAVRLPTEVEWEFAARGNSYIQKFESLREQDIVVGGPWPVDNNTLDRSWCGCVAMNSNLQEWTIDQWDENAYMKRDAKLKNSRPSSSFLYTGFDPNALPASNGTRTVRGSSFQDIPANRVLAIRRYKPINAKEETLGFRIVVPVVNEEPKGR